MKNAEERQIEKLKLDSVIQALRNSFAHGGILPMSPSQAGQERFKSQPSGRDSVGDPNQIDRIYFVSKWTGEGIKDVRGWNVLEFGLDALDAFWRDWRNFLLGPGHQVLQQLDQAA